MDKIKAVSYCRVANADDWVMQRQSEVIERYAESEGFLITDCYCDNGKSGITLDRPGFNSLMSDIRNGNVKFVIAKDASRIARGYHLLNDLIDEVESYGVTLITVNDGNIGVMTKEMNAFLQAYLALSK